MGSVTETIPDRHARQAFLAHLGLALMQDRSFHNFVLQIGPPRAGKSTLLGIVNLVCGETSDPFRFAGPSLFGRDLEGKRSRAMWVDRRAVCVDELPAEALREEELLKLMSAHSGVEMRRIGKDERTENRWKPKLFLSTNDTPHYKDTSGAIRHRAILIECPNGPRPEDAQDKQLMEKLLPEIGAFVAACLWCAEALIKRGYYPRSAHMKQLLDEIEHAGNPLKAFLRECCVLEPGAKITSDELHKAYVEYVLEGGNSPLAKNKMSSAIRDMHMGVSTGEWMRWNSRPARCLKGIRLRTEEDGDPVTPGYQDDPLLVPLPDLPTPPADSKPGNEAERSPEPVVDPQEQTECNQADPLNYALPYPESLTSYMDDPPPSEPCATCGEQNYAPYYGRFARRKWGCATCYPQIPKSLGRFNPEKRA
jgi:phage/plasmid-associated DNA primase